ncbi:MAG: ATP-binding protein [Dehalococcoidia bacterium]
MTGRFDWVVSLQTRLILASAAIVVLAIFVTSAVFVYRDRLEQRTETLRQIASATQGFSVSNFAPANVKSFDLTVGQSDPGVAIVPGPPPPVVSGGSITSDDGRITSTGQAAVINSVDLSGSSDYRIILVNSEGEVVNDPVGGLAGVKISYPEADVLQSKKSYVTWPGKPETATGGLIFLAPTTGTIVSPDGVRAIAAIDSTSLTADWLATLPQLGISALVGIPLAMLAVVLVTRRITLPLRHLTVAVDGMSRGDFDQRVEVQGRDEVATLASSFTVMAGRVKERDTQLRNLIANVSHDLRTPLTSIQGYAEALADGVTKPGDIERSARIIRDEARHASSLLANLLGLSEIESGEVVVRRVEYDVSEIVERCIRRLEPRALERGVTIHLRGTSLPALSGDPEKIERSVCNLLENAVKFARSRIDVTLAVTDDSASVTVGNDGPPVATEDASRIFDRFYRSSGPSAGTGLGLAIARELIELNGGTIELTSAAPVVFVIRLPVA